MGWDWNRTGLATAKVMGPGCLQGEMKRSWARRGTSSTPVSPSVAACDISAHQKLFTRRQNSPRQLCHKLFLGQNIPMRLAVFLKYRFF